MLSWLFLLTLMLTSLSQIEGYGFPLQAENDQQFWSRLPNGGVSLRPFISEFKLIFPDLKTETVLWTGILSPTQSPPAGYDNLSNRVVASIQAINMCPPNQAPAPNVCMNVPNRVGFQVGISTGGGGSEQDLNSMFRHTQVLFDMTIHMGPFFGPKMTWSWFNANVTYWSISPDFILHVIFAPVTTQSYQSVNEIPQPQCCTCSMPSNCRMNHTLSAFLGAHFFVDAYNSEQRNDPLYGAYFATTNAMMGALAPTAYGQNNPILQYRLASAHYDSRGNLLKGTLDAFLTQKSLQDMYSGLTTLQDFQDYLVFQREDGTNNTGVTSVQWAQGVQGSNGIVFQVRDITFSTPTYLLSRSKGYSTSPFFTIVGTLVAIVILFVF
jgi:hypothetical protein